VYRYQVLARRDEPPFVDLDVVVDCSTGTYVRALARDLGRDLGVGGHLTALRRTRVGGFDVAGAVPLDDVAATDVIDMADAARRCFPVVPVDAARAADVGFGRALEVSMDVDPTAVLGPDGRLLALSRPDPERAGWARPVAVLV
jgi:tRNA pseudouridine55 synthase